MSSLLTLISTHSYPRSRDPDERFNRKHPPHVILSHAGQRLWPRTPRSRQGQDQQDPQVRSERVRTEQDREEQGSFVTSPSRCCQLLPGLWVDRKKLAIGPDYPIWPLIQYFFSLLCTHRPQYAGLASGNSSSKWCRVCHNSQTYSVYSSGNLPTPIFRVTRPTFERCSI